MPSALKLPALPKRDGPAVPRSQTERLWLVGGGLVAFVLLLIGYFFFISPQRAQTSDVKGQVATAQQQNSLLQAKLNTLRAESKNLPRYQAELARARLALPSTSGVSDFVRSLQSLGGATQTDVASLTVGEPAPVQPPATAAPTDPAAGTAPAGSPAAGSPAAAGPGTSPTTAAAAAPPGFSMAISLSVSGSPAGLDKFLDQLQAVQPRAVLVTQITESSAAAGATGASATTTLQLSMQAFVAPDTAPPAVPSPAASP